MITRKFTVFTSWNQYRAFGWRTLAARGSPLDSTFISLQGYRNTNTIERVSQSSYIIASRYSTIKRANRFPRSCVFRASFSPSIYNLRCILGDVDKVIIRSRDFEPWTPRSPRPLAKKFLRTFFFRDLRAILHGFVRVRKNDPEIRRRQCGVPSKVKKRRLCFSIRI